MANVLHIKGPFWQSTGTIVQIEKPGSTSYRALRQHFIDHPALSAFDTSGVETPGTLVAICSVTEVMVTLEKPSVQSFRWTLPAQTVTAQTDLPAAIRQGKLALLLLRTGNAPDVYECLNGFIALPENAPDTARLRQHLQLDAATLGERSGMAELPGILTVHSSGLSIFGSIPIAWNPAQKLPALFRLSAVRLAEGEDYRLVVEKERLTAAERDQWIGSWRELGGLAKPEGPQWVALEETRPDEVPDLYWLLGKISGSDHTVFFQPGCFNLYLSDKLLGRSGSQPSAVARIQPDQVRIFQQNDEIILELGAPQEIEDKAAYTAIPLAGKPAWSESLTFSGLQLSPDSTALPRRLREYQGFSEPVLVNGVPDKPLIWAYLPLANGWAELPFMNLNEQLYVDMGLETPAEAFDLLAGRNESFSGGFSLGNETEIRLSPDRPEETPWEVSVFNIGSLHGQWILQSRPGAPAGSPKISLSLYQPELSLNGFLWLSTGRPSRENALPDLDNWINGLFPVNLSSFRVKKALFPCATLFVMDQLQVFAETTPDAVKAKIGNWQLRNVLNPVFFEKPNAPSADLFRKQILQVWLHHPSLPMVQALPLTQNVQPPNYPSASRQLAPFENPFGPNDTIATFAMSKTANGKEDWPIIPAPNRLRLAAGWQQNADLPLASLSLPGMVLEPVQSKAQLPAEPFDELALKYRLDLPYSDEQYALAQLPKIPRPEGIPEPDTEPQPDQPLNRDTFASHWTQLSTKAGLAAADAIEAFTKSNTANTPLRNLVEPFEWPATLQADLGAYPGTLHLKIQDPNGEQAQELTTEKALKGITARLSKLSKTDALFPRVTQADAYNLNAHALDASATAIQLSPTDTKPVATFRDQRGLHRAHTEKGAVLLQTLVALEETDKVQAIHLTTLLNAVPLKISTGNEWQFWIKDLPIRPETQIFERSGAGRSGENQDVNDPEAFSKSFNFLEGYEWRLASDTSAEKGYLDLNKLHFYPLRLEKVQLDGQNILALDIAGRLQLPLAELREQDNLNNAVRLHFFKTADGLQLQTLEVMDGFVEWPLDTTKGPVGDTPRLQFSSITFSGKKLVLPHPTVKFLLFDTAWSIPLKALELDQPAPEAQQLNALHDLAGNAGIGLETLTLRLFETENGQLLHQLVAAFRLQIGARSRLAFKGLLPYPLSGAHRGKPGVLTNALLFGDLRLNETEVVQNDHTLQIQWNQTQSDQALHFLPGWVLEGNTEHPAPGFATLSFGIEAPAAGQSLPSFTLRSAFVENLIPCRWGDFLQDPLVFTGSETAQEKNDRSRERIFGASAGRINAGITIGFDGNTWQESFLLNGYLEVRNLLSWPTALSLSDAVLTLKKGNNPDHFRHSMRILLNQHELPAELLADQALGNLLFTFARTKNWQFPAVTEHQIVEISAVHPNPAAARVREICRWTTLQEVRWLAPRSFQAFLHYLDGKSTDAGETSESMPGTPPSVIPDPVLIEGRMLNEVGRGIPGLRVELWRADEGINAFFQAVTTDHSGNFRFSVPQKEMSGKDNQGKHRFLKMHFVVLKGSQSLISLTDPRGEWTVGDLGQPFRMVIDQDVPPINIYGNKFNGLLSEALKDTDERLIVVESGAHHWVRLEAVSAAGETFLQFLPDGAQTGILADPGDYKTSGVSNPRWQALPMPFFGRFQADDTHALGLDPVLQLLKPGNPTPLVLAFTSQSNADLSFPISAIDRAETNRWVQLDPNMLEESWFRLWNPAREENPVFLPSIMAALPNTPARLSRSSALRQAFSGSRLQFPPSADLRTPEALGLTGVVQWRSQSLISFNFASDPDKTLTADQPWILIFLALKGLLTVAQGSVRFAAATLLPTPDRETLPQALAISPYLSLGYQPAGQGVSSMPLSVVSGELLCLKADSGQLSPVAGKLVENPSGHSSESDLHTALLQWARETHALLSPDSSLAVLRLREIRRSDGATGQAILATTFAFRNVELLPRPEMAYRVFNLRAEVGQLHFREGQFGGLELPVSSKPFELAPPQVTGVQALYLDDWDTAGIDPALEVQDWPWGLNGLRVSTQLTESGRAVIGAPETDAAPVRWWQGLQYSVQFRAAGNERSSAGLPPLFRARAIRSLLPALPDLPLPEMSGTPGEQWQSILPGTMRLLTLGARAGVYNVYRHQVLRQMGKGSQSRTLVSGSIPVQHRYPRPVHLPFNRPGREQQALRPWAGKLEFERNSFMAANPADAAFFAEGPNIPARALSLQLAFPVRGEITNEWNGQLVFCQKSRVGAGSSYLPDWDIAPELNLGKQIFRFKITPTPPNAVLCTEPGSETLAFELDGATDVEKAEALRVMTAALNAVPAGQILNLNLYVRDTKSTPVFRQSLQFPLRMADTDLPRLPLEPRFIYFEDPEYNRLLASASGNAQAQVRIKTDTFTLRLSTDRKVYNPESRLVLRIDWTGETAPQPGELIPLPSDYGMALDIKRISQGSGAVRLLRTVTFPILPQQLAPGILLEFDLPELTVTSGRLFEPGEVLQLELRVQNQPPGSPTFELLVGQVVLALDIIEEPVIPVSPAAYALLRARGEGPAFPVDCPRFAWSPAATRIEMVNPDDLLQEVVRRRAIFKWTDSVRPGVPVAYKVQKIAGNGSTHFPEFGV